MPLNYDETKKLDEFVGRIYEAGDMVAKNNHPDPREWPKDQTDLWGVLDDLGTEIINGFELDETYFDDMERYNGITANDV